MMAYNNYNNSDRDTIEFRIVKQIGVLTTYQTGWSKELNIVSWNGGTPKYDIRDWNPEHERMTKGITLYESEAKKLAENLVNHFSNSANMVASESQSEMNREPVTARNEEVGVDSQTESREETSAHNSNEDEVPFTTEADQFREVRESA